MSRKTNIAILLLSIALLASACSARKKVVQPTSPQSFEWLTAKLDIQAGGNGLSFDDLSGQLRMRKDSLVWVSVTAMGIELARMKVSTDSVWLINRIDKTYLAEPVDTISNQLGMSLSLPLVQAQLLGNNEGLAPAEGQTVQLKNFTFGNFSAKVKYSNIRLDETTTFPLKITDKMERFKLQKRR